MIKRLLITLVLAAAVIFIPYYVSLIPIRDDHNFAELCGMKKEDPNYKVAYWLVGVLVMSLASLLLFIFKAFQSLVNWIRYGK